MELKEGLEGIYDHKCHAWVIGEFISTDDVTSNHCVNNYSFYENDSKKLFTRRLHYRK